MEQASARDLVGARRSLMHGETRRPETPAAASGLSAQARRSARMSDPQSGRSCDAYPCKVKICFMRWVKLDGSAACAPAISEVLPRPAGYENAPGGWPGRSIR